MAIANSSSARQLVDSVAHWHQRFEISPGVYTPGTYDPGFLLEKMDLSDDLSGKRILDIGASDGFFSLQLRRRGAEIVAVDYRPKQLHGFAVMEQISGLDFDYRQLNVYHLNVDELGTFDIVLFLGVLYHLPDLIRALAIIRAVSAGQLFIETHCSSDVPSDIPAARYYRGATLNNDPTNFWSPNARCIADMLFDAAFDVERSETWGERYFALCRSSEDPSRQTKLQLAYGLL